VLPYAIVFVVDADDDDDDVGFLYRARTRFWMTRNWCARRASCRFERAWLWRIEWWLRAVSCRAVLCR